MQNTPRPRITLARTTRWLILAALSASSVGAQTADDGLMVPKKTLMMGVVYAHDSWDQYWEGTLKRSNGNIGTLTTESTTLVGAYGVTDRLELMATLPYIRTHASQGVLHDLNGFQDLSITAKLRLLGHASMGDQGAKDLLELMFPDAPPEDSKAKNKSA